MWVGTELSVGTFVHIGEAKRNDFLFVCLLSKQERAEEMAPWLGAYTVLADDELSSQHPRLEAYNSL